jgi:sugar phosphate isomerase/epimerase
MADNGILINSDYLGGLASTCEFAYKHGFDIEISDIHLETYLDYDIEPRIIHLPYKNIYLTDPDENLRQRSVEKLLKLLENAYSKNVEIAVLHIEWDHLSAPPIPIEEKVKNFKTAVSEILRKADEYGIKIALENNGYIKDSFADPDELLMVIEDLAEKYNNVGVCFDVGHANQYAYFAQKDIQEIFEKLEKYVISIHLHEGKDGKDDHLPPQGLLPEKFYKKIVSLGIPITFEMNSKCSPEEILKGRSYLESFRSST